MTPPATRRLLLVASDATPRGSTTPIRRYRLGRVLMHPQEMYGLQDADRASEPEVRRQPRALAHD